MRRSDQLPIERGRGFLPARLRSIAMLLAALCWVAATAGPACLAQSLADSAFDAHELTPLPLPSAGDAPKRFALRRLQDLVLPGPLPPRGASLIDGRLEIPLSSGVARISWLEGNPQVQIEARATAAAEPRASRPTWVDDPSGRYRSRASGAGWIITQRRCSRCPQGWRTRWRLRLAGDPLAPPLLDHKRLFVGAFDNHVYALRLRNGHRLWSADVRGRVSRPLVRWIDHSAEPSLDLVLVVPNRGDRIIALEAQSGRRVASFELPRDQGQFVGIPVVLPGRRLALARQRYQAAEASLMLFELALAPEQLAGFSQTVPRWSTMSAGL